MRRLRPATAAAATACGADGAPARTAAAPIPAEHAAHHPDGAASTAAPAGR